MIIIIRMSKLCLLMMMLGTIVNGISYASLACSSYCREDKNARCTGRCISFYPRYSNNSEGNLIDEQCWDLSSCAGFPIIHHYVPVEKEICSSECGKWEGASSDGWSYFPIVVCVESLPEDYSIPTNICEAYEFWMLFPAFLLILYFIL